MKQYILLLCVLSFFVQNYCMIINAKRSWSDFKDEQKEEIIELFYLSDDLISQIISHLDYKSNMQFIRTSKNLYERYKNKDILLTPHPLKPDDYTNAMIFYARQNDIKKIEHLMEHEGEINKKNRENILKYFQIKGNENIEKVIEIYAEKYDEKSDYLSIYGWDFIQNIPVLYMRLKQGYNPYSVDKAGWTIYSYAISRNHHKILRFLFTHQKINFNIADNSITLLLEAISSSTTDCLKILLADPRIDRSFKNEENETLLYYCENQKKPEVFKLLLREIDPNIQNNQGKTVLHQACSNKNFEIIKILLADTRVNQNLRDKDDKTPMYYLLKSMEY